MHWVDQYITTRFAEGGRTREGCDCWGLVRLVLAEQFGVAVPSFDTEYADTSDGRRIGNIVTRCKTDHATWVEIPRGSERPGDIALCWGFYRADGTLQKGLTHVGIVVWPGAHLNIKQRHGAYLAYYRESPAERAFLESFHRHVLLSRAAA